MTLERAKPRELPRTGAVGGVDIGWSTTKRTSAAARLSWTENEILLIVERFRAVEPERTKVLEVVFDQPLLGVAFDGPLTTGLLSVTRYRHAEQMLTAGFQPLIGKPGQSSSPNGIRLNKHATDCALSQIARQMIAEATHPHGIHSIAVAEAFPTSFLGVMVQEPEGHKTGKKKTSDVFFELLSVNGTLDRLLARLLPDRAIRVEMRSLTDHDERAALVCAISALCVAANDYTTVGDNDGWIILPPYDLVAPWAVAIFEKNAQRFAATRAEGGIRMGLYNGRYPPVPLEDFNSTDREIAAMFLEDEGWEPR